jgi:Mrp family chromosome partitioning ATPase
MKEFLEEMGSQFDTVVLDTPPLISVTDPVVLSQHVSASVVVVRTFSTQRELARRVRDLLAQTRSKTLGVILNNADMPITGNYLYDSYYYRYDYYYYGGDDDESGKSRSRQTRS